MIPQPHRYLSSPTGYSKGISRGHGTLGGMAQERMAALEERIEAYMAHVRSMTQ